MSKFALLSSNASRGKLCFHCVNQICGSEAQNGGSLMLPIGACGATVQSELALGFAMKQVQTPNQVRNLYMTVMIKHTSVESF